MDLEDQEKIFMEIYAECDNNNTDNVQVSALLSYIGPYIDSNSHHFEELKQTLDPANVNPLIDKQTFLNAMMSWTEKFKNEVDFNFNNEEISRQSTPTKHLTVDFDGLNISNISAYSLTGSVFSPVDPNVLQDQNNELQHQNKKLCECLDDVKYQLTGLEEQNVSLQNEIERNNKTSQADQKLIKTLQAKCAEYEKEREEHTRIANENKINCENLLTIKRAKVELENRIKELETQNKAHLETIEKLSDLSNEKDEENEKLRKEIEERDVEIVRTQEREAEWRQKCAENELNIKNFISETNDLKNHIQSLEALIENQNQSQNQNQNESFQNILKMENFEPDLQADSPSSSATSIKHKSTSLSPEDQILLQQQQQQQQQQSPHESLHSELSHISTLDCFNSCEQRINQLEEEAAKLYEELRQQVEQATSLRKQKEAAEQELTTHREETKALTSESNELKTQLEAAMKEQQQLKNENKQVHSKVSYYKVINKNVKIQLEAKQLEVVSMRKKLANRTNIEEKLTNENKELAEKLMATQQEIKELKENNCKLMNEMCSLERAVKLERKRNTRVDLNSRINDLEEQLEQARSKNQHLTSTISGLTLDKQQLISKLEVAECNDHAKRKVEGLETKLHKYRKTIIDLENQIQNLNIDTKKYQQQYTNLRGYIDGAQHTLHSVNNLLKSTSKYVSNIWNDYFLQFNVVDHLEDFNKDEDVVVNNDEPLQHEIKVLQDQIHVTTKLLNTFSKIKNNMKVTNESGEKEKMKTKERKRTFNRNSDKIDVRTLCNPHESTTVVSNESLLSKLSPKRFFLKPPTLIVRPKDKTHFVFPPMSPECSASASVSASAALSQMPDAQTPETETEAEPRKNEDVEEDDGQQHQQFELNNNNNVPVPVPVSVSVPVLVSRSRSEPGPESELGPTNPINTTVMLPQLQTTKNSETSKSNKISATSVTSVTSATSATSKNSATSGNSINSTFTKIYSDSFIEKILTEQKIEDPVAQMEETRVSDDKEESDASESVSSKEDDDSEGVEKKDANKKLKRGRKIRDEEEIIKERLARQVRSLSEGAATSVLHQYANEGDVMVFPNLQDDALKALGLLPNDGSTNNGIRTFQRAPNRRGDGGEISDAGSGVQHRCGDGGRARAALTTTTRPGGGQPQHGDRPTNCRRPSPSSPMRRCRNNRTSHQSIGSFTIYCSSLTSNINKCRNVWKCSRRVAHRRVREPYVKPSPECDQATRRSEETTSNYKTCTTRNDLPIISAEEARCGSDNDNNPPPNYQHTTAERANSGGTSAPSLHSGDTAATGLAKCVRHEYSDGRETRRYAPHLRGGIQRAAGYLVQALGLQKTPRMDTASTATIKTQPTRH